MEKLEDKANQVPGLEIQIQQLMLQLEQLRNEQQQKKIGEAMAGGKASANEEMLKQQLQQAKMNSEYQSMQFQNDIIKYKMSSKDLESQIQENERVFNNKMKELKE